MVLSSHVSHVRLVALACLLLACLGWSRGAHAQTCPAGYGFCSNNGGCCPVGGGCCPGGCCASSEAYCCPNNTCSASPTCGSTGGGSGSGSGGTSSGSGSGGNSTNSTGSCNTVSDCPPAGFAGASQVECTNGICTYPGAFCNAGTSVCGMNCVCPIHSTISANGCVCDPGYEVTLCDGTPCGACGHDFMCSPSSSSSGGYNNAGKSGCSTAGSTPGGWGSTGLWLVAGATAIVALRGRRRRGTFAALAVALLIGVIACSGEAEPTGGSKAQVPMVPAFVQHGAVRP